jgi:hypothetical protein
VMVRGARYLTGENGLSFQPEVRSYCYSEQLVHGIHAATSEVENLAQGLSCQLKFVHEWW